MSASHPKATESLRSSEMTLSSTNGHWRNVIVRLRSSLENQASSRVRAHELRRHRSARSFVKSFARTMQRNHVSRIDFLECPDRISNVVLLIGREMKAPDHRMNFFHTRGDLSLPDRVDHAAMTARS